jgi:hypothetical protein
VVYGEAPDGVAAGMWNDHRVILNRNLPRDLAEEERGGRWSDGR